MPEPPRVPGARSVPCQRMDGGSRKPASDVVVVEEPLELRVGGVAVATLMRTPGGDRELALGFFLTEGWIESITDVGALALCARTGQAAPAPASESGAEENVADLIPAAGARGRSPTGTERLHVVSSSCGVCGKRTIEEVLAGTPLSRTDGGTHALPKRPNAATGVFSRRDILGMPELLRGEQRLFRATGAIHAAGLFDETGRILFAEEDVGRHNAVDKVVGRALLEGNLPLSRHALQVSGRVSFEIVQKAYRAGIPLIAAVSGVSSLAIDLAEKAGITVAGFVRGETFGIYTHPERVRE